jgi:hypothetical protein
MDQKTIVLYLHMKVKRILMGYRAENLSELLVRVSVILRAIPVGHGLRFFSSG